MALPQRTLGWLYSVLTKDHHDPRQTYHDPNRTYQDVVNALVQYPSLSPRTDVYTYENGFSALLLRLIGTLPVSFRGTTYRFPVALWIPNTYPREPPLVYVTPPQDMAVRPGQHVTLEGRVYHHYLAHWVEASDRSTIADFLSILRDVFAKEPPVRYRQQPQQPQAPPQQDQTPPPIPPLPPGMSPRPAPSQVKPASPVVQTPPQLPPKPGAAQHSQSVQAAERYKSPPPLPPLPPKASDSQRIPAPIQPPNALGSGNRASQQFMPPQFEPQPPVGHSAVVHSTPHSRNISGPQSYQTSPPGPPSQAAGYQPVSPAQQPQFSGHEPHPAPNQLPPGSAYQQYSYPPNYQHAPPVPAPAPAPKPAAPDLLTSPFELELPSFAPAGPAPPIPPNPEKDALIHAVSQTLAETLQAQASQSDNAAYSLISQSHSLQSAMTTLQTELSALTALNATLNSNTTILQQTIHRADATIADAHARASSAAPPSTSSNSGPSTSDTPTGLPPIDEVLVAPTVVGKQLYDLVAEEQGLQHALYALQAALVRGVIGVDSWSRQTRGLAREAFLKRALIRKVARGMALEESTV